MQILIDTLEAARLTADPAKAMDLADALADLRAMNRDDLTEVRDAVSSFDALRDHMAGSPFTDMSWDDLLAPAVVQWLAVLEDIAS
jgi:hypothetical protein